MYCICMLGSMLLCWVTYLCIVYVCEGQCCCTESHIYVLYMYVRVNVAVPGHVSMLRRRSTKSLWRDPLNAPSAAPSGIPSMHATSRDLRWMATRWRRSWNWSTAGRSKVPRWTPAGPVLKIIRYVHPPDVGSSFVVLWEYHFVNKVRAKTIKYIKNVNNTSNSKQHE